MTMKKEVRKAIAKNEYNIGFFWEYFTEDDTKLILDILSIHSKHSKIIHMGMIPLIGIKDLFEAFNRADTSHHYDASRRTVLIILINEVESLRYKIRLQIKRDLTTKARLARHEARKKHDTRL